MLEAKSLSFKTKSKYLIKEISLQFKPGVLYGILGPNGSGKSTLLKNIAGIWTPTKGDVFWKKERLLKKSREEISRTITLVPQNPQIFFDLPVMDFILMGRYPYKRESRSDIKDLVEWSLKTADIQHLKERSLLFLSQGERKRVYIARALITESPILLLDEPSSSLDIRHQLEIWELLRDLAKKGKTVIVTNHDLTFTEKFCDEIAILDKGRCLGLGKYQKLLSKSVLREVFGVVKEEGLRASFALNP